MCKYDRADAVSQQYIQPDSLCLLRSVPRMILQTSIQRVFILICIHIGRNPMKKKYLIISYLLCVKFAVEKKAVMTTPQFFSSFERRHDSPKKTSHAYTRTLSVRCIHLLKSVFSNGKFKRVKKCVLSFFFHACITHSNGTHIFFHLFYAFSYSIRIQCGC